MTAAVSIVVAQHDNVLVVPNQAIHNAGNQRTVAVMFEGQQIQVSVTVGLAGDTTTEVTGGSLKEGDEVVINTSSSTRTNNNLGGGSFGGPPGGDFFISP
jgi:multidrug efflux pump subunit AcrA (membrane-fusion protein)